MAHNFLSLLSEAQRDYLRLVREGRTSTEIAQLRGGSHHTVNAEIALAVRIVGAKNRAEASARVAELELALAPAPAAPQSASYEYSYDPPPVVERAEPILPRAQETPVEGHLHLPISTRLIPTNQLTFWQRTAWILILAMAVALVVGGLVTGITAQLEGLGRHM
jgi:DNA-binding CsgD family transcriptional regulator